jgi:DNA-binding MarR family transcriptional regulator
MTAPRMRPEPGTRRAAARKAAPAASPTLLPGERGEIVESFEPHVRGIDYGQLDELVGYAVRRAQISMYIDFYQSLARWGISPKRYSALTLIARNPGLMSSKLASLLGIARSGAVVLTRALETLGYVERAASATDGRAHALKLTPTGRRALRKIDVAVMAHDRRVSARLSDKDRATLIELLSRLHT